MTDELRAELLAMFDELERLRTAQETALTRVRAAWANYKSAVFQGDSEEAYALMEMDSLLGVNERGEPMGEPTLWLPTA